MLANPRQSKFVTEYLKDGDAKRAIIAAGVTCKHPSAAAYRLLKKPGVRAEIQKELANIREAARATKAYVVSSLKRVADRSMQDVPVVDREGEPTGEYKFDSGGANKALELLGKTLGIFVDKQITVTMTLEELVNASMALTPPQ